MQRRKWITRAEAAEILGVSDQRVSALVSSGRIKTMIWLGRRAYDKESVLAYRDSPDRKPGKRAKKKDD